MASVHRAVGLAHAQPSRSTAFPPESGHDKIAELRALAAKGPAAEQQRDDLMVAGATSNMLGREDMAAATGLARAEVDDAIRSTAERDQANRERGLHERTARHMAS